MFYLLIPANLKFFQVGCKNKVFKNRTSFFFGLENHSSSAYLDEGTEPSTLRIDQFHLFAPCPCCRVRGSPNKYSLLPAYFVVGFVLKDATDRQDSEERELFMTCVMENETYY